MTSSHNLNNQILSPVDSFILEYRSKISEDKKKLETKSSKINEMRKSLNENSKKNVTKNEKFNGVKNNVTPKIVVTDYNKENIQNKDDLVPRINNELENLLMKDNSRDTDNNNINNRHSYSGSREEEKQRFIDYLISSPDILSPREGDTSRRFHTPDLPLPVNQRQVDIEKLQDLFAVSPVYVPNDKDVNQFNESYIPADCPHNTSSNQTNQTNGNNTEVDNSNLFEQYVKTFESNSESNSSYENQKSQSMTITPNTFAHDQSCKKIVKIGEYSPLNPHFQPQPCVLNFNNVSNARSGQSHHQTGNNTSQPEEIINHKETRDVEVQMPSKKKTRFRRSSIAENDLDDGELEVIGTNALPNIEHKINPENRFSHHRSQQHVETCGGGDPIATIKLKQELYKVELDKQIEEKRKVEEERRRKEQEEDEKAQRAYLEQQQRLRREFEEEQENRLQSVLQRQMREDILKEKIRQLEIQQEEEKLKKRKEKEAISKRNKRELENTNPWIHGNNVHGNPTSIMLPNPFGNPVNSRLDPITSYSKPPLDRHDRKQVDPSSLSYHNNLLQNPHYQMNPSNHLNPSYQMTNSNHLNPSYQMSNSSHSNPSHLSQHTTNNLPNHLLSPQQNVHYSLSPASSRSPVRSREVSPASRSSIRETYRHIPYTTATEHVHNSSRDISPIRPPVERFRDLSPVRPLRDTLRDSPALYRDGELYIPPDSVEDDNGSIIDAPQKLLSMPVKKGKHHHRVTFTTTDENPIRSRSTSPVLPAVKTHHRMKDLATSSYPVSVDESEDIKLSTNRNVLTQLGEFRRQLYLENVRMNERLRRNQN